MVLSARRLIAFSDAINEEWFPALRELDAQVLTRNYECSFYTPLGVLVHMGNVEKSWARVIDGEPFGWDRPSKTTWETIDPVLEHLDAVRADTHQVIDDLPEDAFDEPRRIDVEIPGFVREELTVEEALFTLFTHEQWHRGELLAVLWSEQIEPPPLDWPRYGTPLTPGAAHPEPHPGPE